MIAILDLGVGNLSSVRSGLQRAGAASAVVQNEAAWETLLAGNSGASSGEDSGGNSDDNQVSGNEVNTGGVGANEVNGVILPGVGAFGDAMFQLRASGLLGVVRKVAKRGMPLFGICLGMQLLFSMSEEHGQHPGLGLFPGRVVRFAGDVKVPHMGWNSLSYVSQHPLLSGVGKGEYVYFVHSYHAVLEDEAHLLASADYGATKVPAVVARNRVFGAQFHPEKSGETGDKILHNFVQICADWADRIHKEAAEKSEHATI